MGNNVTQHDLCSLQHDDNWSAAKTKITKKIKNDSKTNVRLVLPHCCALLFAANALQPALRNNQHTYPQSHVCLCPSKGGKLNMYTKIINYDKTT